MLVILRQVRHSGKRATAFGLVRAAVAVLAAVLREAFAANYGRLTVTLRIPEGFGEGIDVGDASPVSSLARRERHFDQRRAAKHQIDPDQETDRPFRRAGQAGDNQERNQDIHQSRNQQP